MIQTGRIDTVYLYDQPVTADIQAVLMELNASCGQEETAFEPRLPPSGGFALLENDRYHISVRGDDRRQPAEEFTRALDAPVTQTGRIKFTPRLRRHRAALLVSVGLGSLSAERDTDSTPGFAAVNTDPAQALAMIAISHAVARAVVRNTPPLAVHWRQSNRLLIPEQVIAEAEHKIPLSYVYNPTPFSSGTRQNGKVQSGLRALGSEYVTGRTVVLHESGLGFSQGCQLIEAIMGLALLGTFDLNNGRRIQVDQWPTCEIRLRPPSAAFPSGTLELMPDEQTHPPRRAPDDNLRRAFGRTVSAPDLGLLHSALLGMRAALAR